MEIQVQKWGNSLAIRIPKSFAVKTQIDHGSYVDLSMQDGKLVATPLKKRKYTLAELVDTVTDENIHTEIDTGDAVGREVW